MSGTEGVGIRELAERCDLDVDDVRAFIDVVKAAIRDGERVQLTGLGAFSRVELKPRKFSAAEVANLASQDSEGEVTVVKNTRFRLRFRPSRVFKQQLNNGTCCANTNSQEEG